MYTLQEPKSSYLCLTFFRNSIFMCGMCNQIENRNEDIKHYCEVP